MIKNKSSSVSISNRGSGSASKSNSSSRKSTNKPKKPTIDREIAKKLDTLDRQGLKYLKESLKASRTIDKDRKYLKNNAACRCKRTLTLRTTLTNDWSLQ
jgi:hypothetical protein